MTSNRAGLAPSWVSHGGWGLCGRQKADAGVRVLSGREPRLYGCSLLTLTPFTIVITPESPRLSLRPPVILNQNSLYYLKFADFEPQDLCRSKQSS